MTKRSSRRAPADEASDALRIDRRTMLRGSLAGLVALKLGFIGCDSDSPATPDPFLASGRPIQDLGEDTRIPVFWVETAVCTGCSEALLDSFDPPAEELLGAVRIEFHEAIMDLSGPAAMARVEEIRQAYAGGYVLIVDGAIPVGEYAEITALGSKPDGTEWTAEQLVKTLAADALAVVAAGTCASWGGIPSAGANPYGYGSLPDALGAGVTVVRVPGCPPNAGWIAGSIAALYGGSDVPLDAHGRPLAYYAGTVHEVCPRKPTFDAGDFAVSRGDPEKCLFNVGCKGPFARGDCPQRLWNEQSSCIHANHPCLACTAPGFPDSDALDPA